MPVCLPLLYYTHIHTHITYYIHTKGNKDLRQKEPLEAFLTLLTDSDMGAKSKRKGKVGERELAGELSRLFGVACRRGVQYSGLGGDDVVGLPGVHVECKRTERLALYAALGQAIADAEGREPSEVPIVAHRANGKPWVAIVRLDDLPALLKALAPFLAA